ncbi:MAG TPA: ABC transporter permease [Candidatus Eisenbacteria bacterium]|nr:ABC transporter permease [Candidatus Eisenbacteria bacterium]
MIVRALVAAFVKDVRLLVRDRVGLVFLTIAPLIVMSVAGFSLSTLFGGVPQPGAYVLPVVDEDDGRIAAELRERLTDDATIEVRTVPTREQALELVHSRESAAVLVIPAGTSAALARGSRASLRLLTDPVKFVELTNVRFLVEELRQAVGQHAIDLAQRRIDRVRARALAEERRLERRFARLRAALARTADRVHEVHADVARRVEVAGARLENTLREGLRRTEAERLGAARRRLERELAPLHEFVDALAAYRGTFESWLAGVREQAGRFADRIPPPPEPPALPAALEQLAHGDDDALASRILGAPGDVALPKLPLDLALPPLPEPPAVTALALPSLPDVRLPRLLDVVETSVSGAPSRLNSFDQYVPGFSITFLMLGMLIGVAMTLIDERELGTLDRVRATQAPVATLVLGKLTVRFLVGVLQMIALLGVGRAAFGVSLGPQPVALLLPTVGIVFVGTAFGVLVAGLAPTRDAVIPLGAIAIVTMCAVGGCWWPIDLEPRWMRGLARVLPTTWAMSGFKDLMMRHQTVTAALEPTLVLLLFGLAFLVVGLVAFRPSRV